MQTEQKVLATPGGESSCSGPGLKSRPPPQLLLRGAGTGVSSWSGRVRRSASSACSGGASEAVRHSVL